MMHFKLKEEDIPINMKQNMGDYQHEMKDIIHMNILQTQRLNQINQTMFWHKLKFKTDAKINSEVVKAHDEEKYLRRKLEF